MNKITLKLFIFFLALNLWNLGFFEPLASGLGGEVTLAEAHHKPWHTSGGGGNCKKNPKKCQPPTVSELPIQYMILSGIAVITLSGGMAFFIRKRRMKNSLEV